MNASRFAPLCRPVLFTLPAIAAPLFLAGCAGMQSTSVSSAVTPAVALQGTVHGGQQVISGSHIYLYAVGNAGYGSASTSLLSLTGAGVSPDSNGNGYVTSDSGGNFAITGDYTCPSSSSQTYLLALGGNPGLAPGTYNTAIVLVSALGSCGNLSASTRIGINELSTVAAVTALQEFATDDVHIGTTSGSARGLTNAFLTVQNIVDLGSGTARSTNLVGSGTVPVAKLNTLADVLVPCVNSASPSSTPCQSFFAAATPPNISAPANTFDAMFLIARYPGSKVSALYNQVTTAPPFTPTLSSAPNDWTIAINYTGAGLVSPGALAVDYYGDVYTVNCPTCRGYSFSDSLSGFGPQGFVLTGSSGYTNSHIHKPQAIAFDEGGGFWITSQASGSAPDEVIKFNYPGNFAFSYSGSALAMPSGIAIDNGGTAWIASQATNSLVKISSTGTYNTSVTSAGFNTPTGVAIDNSGNIFASGTGSSSILKFQTNGTVLSGTYSGYTGGGLAQPLGIAINYAGDVWAFNNYNGTVSEINGANGTAISPTSGDTTGVYKSGGVAIDGAGTIWIANCRGGCSGGSGTDAIVRLNADGSLYSPTTTGYQDPTLNGAYNLAIDLSGNVWVSNTGNSSITEFIGAAAPVLTPLSYAAASGVLGGRP